MSRRRYLLLGTTTLLPLLLACSSSADRPTSEATGQSQAEAQPSPNQPAQRVTVLMRPSRQELNRVETDGSHYSVSERDGDITVSITGSLAQQNRGELNIDVAALKPKPAGTVRGVPVYVTENEGIRTATWTEKGTAYAVDIECQTATDARCSSPKYILDLVAGLVDVTER